MFVKTFNIVLITNKHKNVDEHKGNKNINILVSGFETEFNIMEIAIID